MLVFYEISYYDSVTNSFPNMPRGGHRENAGRKASWKNSETQVIRVPRIFVPQLIQIAKDLDEGKALDLVTKSSTTLFKDEPPTNRVEVSPGQLSFGLEISEVTCPKCGSPNLKKNGTQAGRQKYKCLTCMKYFVQRT